MSKKGEMMGFMTSLPSKAESVKKDDCDKRFARPEGVVLDLTFEEHAKKIFEENKVSMALLAK